MPIFHRRPERTGHSRHPDRSTITESVPALADDRLDVPVLLSPGLVDIAPALAQALGPGFSVQTDGPGRAGVMIVGAVGPAGVSFLRVSHPGVILLVVDRRGRGPRPIEAVAHLEAGADGYLPSPPVAEVASHVRALARRAGQLRQTA